MSSLLNHLRRQGNVTRDYKVTHAKPFNYLIVSDIKTRCYL